MSDHHFRMYAGIRPSGAHHRNGFSQHRCQRRLNTLLHAHPVGLLLPSAILRPIVCQVNEISIHYYLQQPTKIRKNQRLMKDMKAFFPEKGFT
jgi:hypothetical protein